MKYHVITILLFSVLLISGCNSKNTKVESNQTESSEHEEMSAFSKEKMKTYLSTGSGLIFRAPKEWHNNSSDKIFQVIDPETNTQFSSSFYENQGLSTEQWAEYRFQAVQKGMPYLKLDKEKEGITGASWNGFMAEYSGTFPGNNYVSKYLVVAFIKNNMLFSFTVTSDKDVYSKNKSIYTYLISNNLDVYKVNK